jgi:hypothetical protein
MLHFSIDIAWHSMIDIMQGDGERRRRSHGALLKLVLCNMSHRLCNIYYGYMGGNLGFSKNGGEVQ